MFAKMVLPRLGGTPNVWNTCMVFYQTVLLLGYVYAHLATRLLGPRRQAVLHLAVLGLPWLVLPIVLPHAWLPPADANPIPWLLTILTVSLGLPLLVVSASAPMLQAWFAGTGHHSADDPYHLYSASNAGSMIALLGYPFLLEPLLTLTGQSRAWSYGFGALSLLTAACAVALWLSPKSTTPADSPAPCNTPSDAAAPTLGRRLRWMALALAPSSLLLGVTTHISSDLLAAPLLWVVPFALYLLTFVLVFARRPMLRHSWMVALQPFFLVPLVAWMFLTRSQVSLLIVPLHLLTFFVTAMVCHGELAASRPAAAYLTEFYLWMSIGGVLGGVLNAIVAPLIFSTVLEYPIMIAVACLLRPVRGSGLREFWSGLRAWLRARRTGGEGAVMASAIRAGCHDLLTPLVVMVVLGIAVLLVQRGFAGHSEQSKTFCNGVLVALGAVACLRFARRPARFGVGVALLMVVSHLCVVSEGGALYTDRSFFGILRVRDLSWEANRSTKEDPVRIEVHTLTHGSTTHGVQVWDEDDPKRQDCPASYYYPTGPLGQVINTVYNDRPTLEMGAIGLGAGSIAGYGRPGWHITFYEIDPAVKKIAENPKFFTYLSDCKGRYDILLGDARVKLAQARPGQYDLLIFDAYSSDAIPMHLVTREAVELYRKKLAEHGLLLFHISNRYFNLEPVMGRLAEDAKLVCRVQDDDTVTKKEEDAGKYHSHWVVMARCKEDLGRLLGDKRWEPIEVAANAPLWTDDYSNILSVLSLRELHSVSRWWTDCRNWCGSWFAGKSDAEEHRHGK